MGLSLTPTEQLVEVTEPTPTEQDVVSTARRPRPRIYPWLVAGLAFALLLSDYMSRQVLSAVFPMLKADWALSDSQLASLTSVVALMVGLLTFPLSLLADRWGRVRSLVIMAVVWSIATLGCAIASNYEQMLAARFFVGVGEAAYGSVGIAVVLSVFAPRLHSSLSGVFMAGGSFGSVVGVSLGGVIAVNLGWRWSFTAMAVLGLILVAIFRVVVTESRLAKYAVHDEPVAPSDDSASSAPVIRVPVSTLFTNPAVWCAYFAGGFQMFTAAVLLSWMPSFFNRYYGMATDKAAGAAAIIVLMVGTGMVVCGIVTDRVSRNNPARKWITGVVFCTISLVALGIGFRLGTGAPQLILLGIGAFFSGGCSGPTAAMVAGLTHESVRSSALGTLTIANNVLGLALGPFVIGILADRMGLLESLQLAPLFYIAAIVALLVGKRVYPAGLRKLASQSTASA
ncbi:MFS transporter [Prescottella agglutinans]|uniref:MFS family arabinose efflux permease n=1 Tax=Prescottella agglutinans TaxID=1644129 RepID=A0ABT6MAP9_9NOCA|nr:MFS transporter [Prescottella agglutinans]MDH6280955.1 putative MFS family arabinose efflux permease [Prescottella agglutinans]